MRSRARPTVAGPALGDDLRRRRVQPAPRRAQPHVEARGRPVRPGEDRAAEPDHELRGVARRVEQGLGLAGQVGGEERPSDRVEADRVGERGHVHHAGAAAGADRGGQAYADRGPRRGTHLVTDRLQALVVERGGGEAPVVDPARLRGGQQALTRHPRESGVLHGVLAPAAGRGLQDVAHGRGVVEEQRGGTRHREGDEVAVLLGDRREEGERVGADRAEPTGHVERGRAGHADVGGLHLLQPRRDAHAASCAGRRRPSHVQTTQLVSTRAKPKARSSTGA